MFSAEVLRIRAFRDLWLGQAISQLGDALYYIPFMFMAEKVTGSLATVGYVGAAETLPFLLFGPYAGVIADRFDRKRIMLFSDLACTLVIAMFGVYVFFMGGQPSAWSLMAAAFSLSSIRCFFMPAKSAAIPNLVPKDLLIKANSLSMTTFNVMYLGGLAFSAVAMAQLFDFSPRWFFLAVLGLNAVSFLGSAFFILRLPPVIPDRSTAEIRHPLADFRSGLGFIKRRRDLLVLIALNMLFRIGVAPFFVVYVAANKQWFDGHPRTLLWFEFAFFVGMIVGSIGIARVKVERPMPFFIWGLGTVGIMCAGMAFAQNFWLFALLNFLCGVPVTFADIPTTTYMQSSVEDAYRGRVNSVREMVLAGVMPLGMVFAGAMVASWGLVATFLVMGSFMAFGCFAGLLDKEFRDVRMPSLATDSEQTESPAAIREEALA